MVEAVADIGLIGLAVMGQNIILNMNDNGFVVCAYNRTVEKVDKFLSNEAKGKKKKITFNPLYKLSVNHLLYIGTNIVGAHSNEEFCAKLKKPRKIMLLVKAGSAVDDFIHQLLPYLDQGDIIIDGGNSHFPDSTRRTQELASKGILFVGSGVSGGEEGARHGPSLMPGGNPQAWPHIKPIFQAIAAKAPDGAPCCDWVGENGAGHYVKMVHNGIEYGDMQLISEVYELMLEGLGMSHDEMADVFEEWNKGDLDSYLIEITRDILRYKDKDGKALVTKILDTAGQKGTGKWTAIDSLDRGIPVTLIGEAVYSRCLSSLKNERVRASRILEGPKDVKFQGDKKTLLDQMGQALYAAKIVSYAQGYMLMRQAAKDYGWHLNYAGIALMWRGGCIIRSVFLGKIRDAYTTTPDLENLLFDSFFQHAIAKAQSSWRTVVAQAAHLGIPTPAHSTALNFYDGLRHDMLPANLIQAQRDYFGAHTYELLAQPGAHVHTNWTGHGGDVSASTYDA
ncbi:6-phosphogluconate dehydrogenase, decarboxylating [Chlamydoabsidia padenii]|nr:6-phosphogluconate dehydrogenase, decarboxylating [Chlamydoabsidia padenii]